MLVFSLEGCNAMGRQPILAVTVATNVNSRGMDALYTY